MQRFFLPMRHRRAICTAFGLAAVFGALGASGCTAFNPAFVNLLGGGIADSLATIPNPPGHVIVAFVNDAEIAEALVSQVEEGLTGLTADELANLRPRVRLRVRITFVDGTFQTLEMISGSRDFVDPTFNAEAVPDLNQNDLSNVVVQCDVAQVSLEPGSNIEVFIPVRQQGYQLVETEAQGGTLTTTFQPRQAFLPQFWPLAIDDVDGDGNIVLRRNVDARDQLTPTTNVVCGSVVAINMTGVLSVPFQINADEPSFDQDDEQTVASIGGRYEFRVTVR
jgi:hypothetical protein